VKDSGRCRLQNVNSFLPYKILYKRTYMHYLMYYFNVFESLVHCLNFNDLINLTIPHYLIPPLSLSHLSLTHLVTYSWSLKNQQIQPATIHVYKLVYNGTIYSGRNKGQKLVGHFLKIAHFVGYWLPAIPLKMYSKISWPKWILVSQILKLVGKWPMANSYF